MVLDEHQDYIKANIHNFPDDGNSTDVSSSYYDYSDDTSSYYDDDRSYNSFESTFTSPYKPDSTCSIFHSASEPEIFYSPCYDDDDGNIVNVMDVCPNDPPMKNCALDGCKKFFTTSIYQV